MELQNATDCVEWHMFLTFRACPQTSNHEADNELREIIEGNLTNTAALAAYGARPQPRELVERQYQEFLRIGVTKFLASSSSQRGYACNLESSYVYPRNPQGGPTYHIIKLIVGFRAIRAARNLPNPQRTRAAYEHSVPQIFGSNAVDVSPLLGNAATRRHLRADLEPVLEELAQLHIVW